MGMFCMNLKICFQIKINFLLLKLTKRQNEKVNEKNLTKREKYEKRFMVSL